MIKTITSSWWENYWRKGDKLVDELQYISVGLKLHKFLRVLVLMDSGSDRSDI